MKKFQAKIKEITDRMYEGVVYPFNAGANDIYGHSKPQTTTEPSKQNNSKIKKDDSEEDSEDPEDSKNSSLTKPKSTLKKLKPTSDKDENTDNKTDRK